MPSNPGTGAAAPIDETLAPTFATNKNAPPSHAPIEAGPMAGPEEPVPGPGGPPTGSLPSGGPGGEEPPPPPPGGETPPPGGETPPPPGGETPPPPAGETPVPDPTGFDEDAEAFATEVGQGFLDLLSNATSGEALEAQNIILRRIALQGDVVPSRVPPPLNITEIGGYVNLLTNLKQTDMLSQVLAGILGVAGPNPPLGWIETATPLTLVPMPNDRPAGPVQPTLPVTVPVRSDFLGPLQAALQGLRAEGCLVPFVSGPSYLPSAGSNSLPPADPLPYIGRVLKMAAATALVDPAADPLALVRTQGSTGPFEIAARSFTSTGPPPPPGGGPPGGGPAVGTAIQPANYEALQCTATTCNPVALVGAPLVLLSAALASAGFYPASPPSQPISSSDTSWTRLTNVTGLTAGVTKLGDELALLYSWDTIAGSVFGGALGWTWNGTQFVSPGL